MQNNLIDTLLKNVLIHKNQPFACYVKYQEKEYYKYNQSNEYSTFRLASVTKQFIAYGIICLIKDNKLTYQTTLDKIYNDAPKYFSEISILNLLNHTSGLPDYDEDLNEHYTTETQIHDIDVLHYLYSFKTNPLLFIPGTKYHYSNTAYILLGLIIEKLSNQTIDDYLNEKVFKKLNLNNTLINYEGKTTIKNRMYGHTLEEDKLILNDQYWCSATIGDGGIYSNINDLKIWLNYIFNIEYNNLKDTMFKPNYIDNENTQYGMGMRIINIKDNIVYTHSGFTIGTNTLVLYSKDLNLEIIFLTSLGPTDTDIIIENLKEIIN